MRKEEEVKGRGWREGGREGGGWGGFEGRKEVCEGNK